MKRAKCSRLKCGNKWQPSVNKWLNSLSHSGGYTFPIANFAMKSLLLALAAFFLPASLFAAAPTLGNATATVLAGAMADVAGTVSGDSADTTVTVRYGKDTTYGATMAATLPAAGANVPYTITLSGLELGTVYHFQVVASNGTAPDAATADGTFTIPALPPVVTVPIPVITGNAANISALVTSNGAPTTLRLQYGETDAYGFDAVPPGPFSAGRVNAPFTFALTGLKFATTYHYKVVATNGVDPAADTGDRTFTVPAEKPAIVTPAVNVVSSTKAIITANVSAKGANTSVKVLYGTTSALGSEALASVTVLAAESKEVEITLNGLTKADYFYQVEATNSAGTTTAFAPVTGSLLTFKVPQAPQVTATATATANSATVKALVTSHGDFVKLTVAYGLTTSYGATKEIAGIEDDAMQLEKVFEIVDLVRGKTYNYRLTAVNAGGTATTANATFITGTNNLPVANEDIVQTKGRNAMTIDVLANDTDKDADKLTIVRVSQPRRGTAEISGTQVLYTPGENFAGTDEFTYSISDGQTGAAIGRVTIRALQVAIDGVNSAIIKNENGDAAGAYKIIGTAGGKFTARVSIGGENSVVTGQLDSDGKFSTTLANGTNVSFSVKENGASNSIVADFERADGKYTSETTVNAVTERRRAELAGHYNITLPAPGTTTTAGQTSNGLPQGAGFMTMDVKTWGGVSVRGVLGDGSKFSYASTLSGTDAAAAIPIWLSPKDARLSGTVALAGTTNVTATGTMNWYRPADDGAKRFADGFFTSVNATGAAYTPPAKKERVLNAATNDATITLQGGDLSANIIRNIQIDTQSRVQLPKGLVSKLTIYPAKGTFAGTFEHPLDGDQRTFQGVLLPNQNVATGVFTGRAQTGTVRITPGATAVVTPPVQQPGNGNGNGDGNGTGNPGVNLGNGGINFGN